MPNDKRQPTETAQRTANFGALIKTLIGLLAVLIIVIILLLLRSCGEEKGPPTLDPDYPTISDDPNAQPIESEPETSAPDVSQGGGSVTISFKDQVTYSLSDGTISMFYQNPSVSTHNVVAQIILVQGEKEYLLSQSGILKPGYQVTSMTVDENAPKLSEGGYNGKLRLRFYNPETGERAIVDTDIPCTITVKE